MSRQIAILTALFVCTLPLVTTRIYASDEVQYYAYLRSLWFDHDVSFENEYQHFYDAGVTHYDGFHQTFLELTTDTGRRETFATIGAALMWSPFFAVADASVRLRRAMGDTSVAADGYSPPYIAAVAYGSAMYGWLSLVLSLVIVRRVLDTECPVPEIRCINPGAWRPARKARRARILGIFERGATPPAGMPHPGVMRRISGTGHELGARDAVPLLATIAIWIGTPLFFYMYIAPPMSHDCSAFAVAAFVLVWLRTRGRWTAGGVVLLGALAALMVMVREQDGLIAIGPAVDWALDVWHEHGSTRMTLIARGLLGAAAFGVAYLPQLAAYEAINGYPGPSHLVVRKLDWLAPHALGVLLSPEHGLLFWTPLVTLSLIGLIWLALQPVSPRDTDAGRAALPPSPHDPAARRATHGRRAEAADARRVVVCLLLMVVSQVYVAGSVDSWTVAGAFGQRRFVSLTPFFVLGLAVVLTRLRATRAQQWVCATVVALGVWWNLGLTAQFGAGLMDRQRLELGRNAYHNFVTIPARVPELAYRYLFERRSFYKTE